LRKIKSGVALFALCAAIVIPMDAMAAKLGKLSIQSALGEPFAAEVSLTATPEELQTLIARIASSEDYAEQGIDFSPSLPSVHMEIAKRPDNTPFIRLNSPQAHGAPFLELLIQAEWANGRTTRAYSTVPNTPVFSQPATDPLRQTASSALPLETPKSPTELAVAESAPPQVNAVIPNEAAVAKPAEIAPTTTADTPVRAEKISAASVPAPASVDDKATPAKNDAAVVTQKGDTLFAIANKLKMEGVSTEQLLQGLYAANKKAFMGHNMNRLKVGQRLHIPSPEALHAIVPSEAASSVQIQSADWDTYQMKLAAQAQESSGSSDSVVPRQAEGRVSVATQPNATPEANVQRDIVKLSTANLHEGMAGKGDKTKQIAMLEDDATAREKEIKQIEEKNSFLEKQVEKTRALLAIKNKLIADKIAAISQPQTKEAAPGMPKSQLIVIFGALISLIGAVWLYLRPKLRRLNALPTPS